MHDWLCCARVRNGLALTSVQRWGDILGIFGNSWVCACVRSTGDRGMHAHMQANTHRCTRTDSCAPFGSQEREFTQHSHRDTRVDSRHLIVWHFNFTPQLHLPESRLFLSSPSLLLLFAPPVSLSRPLIRCLSWRAIPEPSIIAFCYLAEGGIEFDAPTRSLRDFLCTPIRSACPPVAGRSSILQHGAPNLYHCLSAAPSLHLYLNLFRAPSFCPLSLSVLLYLSLSLSLWHLLHLFLPLPRSLSLTTHSNILFSFTLFYFSFGLVPCLC